MTKSLRDYLWINRSRFTAEEFAERLGVARAYFSRVVNGKAIPSISLAKKIEKESGGEVKWHELMEFCYAVLEQSKLKNP